MSRHYLAGRMTSAPTATLPGSSLYAAAAKGGRLIQVGIFNTTVTACAVALRRLTTTGTQGAGLDELPADPNAGASLMTGFNTHSIGPTITLGEFDRADLGAAVGSGVIWTFGGEGLLIPAGTANGIGILCPVGTGQICDFSFVWDE